MKCEYEYCIYNKDFKCSLDGVTINSLGMCDDCIIISLDKGFLEAEKDKQRKEIDKRWKEQGE